MKLMKFEISWSISCIMETLVTQTAIFPFRGTIILILFLQVVSLIRAQQENLDPLEFTLSANNPKNKTLQPLPKHFDKGGDNQNDCCTLVLFFKITDIEEGSGVDPPKSDGAATFKFQHPNIRGTDLEFSMNIPKDQDLVKSRHILNFDKCSRIIKQTFSIFATTNITDYKEVRVVLINGKFEVPAIKCQVPTTIKLPSNDSDTPGPKPPPNIYPMGLTIATTICALISICCIGALIYVVKVWIPNILKTNNMNMQYQASGGTRNKARGGEQIEKFMGGDESNSEEEKCAVNVSGGDQTGTSQEEKANKVKKILA